MRVIRRVKPFLSVLLVLSGCSNEGTLPVHSFVVATIDGVITETTTGGPKYASPVFSFREVLKLRQDESNPESIIADGGDILMDESGTFFVPDYADMRIMIFDLVGNYMRSFGQRGSGPGDFNYPYLVRIDGDSVIVYDSMNWRSSHYLKDGTLLNIFAPFLRNRFMTGLESIEGGRQLPISVVIERRGDESWESQRADLMSSRGDTLCTVVSSPVFRGTAYTFSLQGRSVPGMSRRLFWGKSLVIFVPPDHLLVSTGVDPELRWYDLSGSLTKITRLDIAPEPVSDSDVAALHARMDSLRSLAGGNQQRIQEQYAENLDIPDYKAYWSNVVVDDSGFIWLLRPLPDATWFDAFISQWRVLSPQGEYLGDVVTPTGWGRFSQGHYLTYLTDPVSGAREAVVYQIDAAVPGLTYPN